MMSFSCRLSPAKVIRGYSFEGYCSCNQEKYFTQTWGYVFKAYPVGYLIHALNNGKQATVYKCHGSSHKLFYIYTLTGAVFQKTLWRHLSSRLVAMTDIVERKHARGLMVQGKHLRCALLNSTKQF